MEQLSSCYFCGGALDASLDEYPVVPKDLHPTPDDQKTVVLCQGCRQKLGTVVETIVSVVENPESTAASDTRAPDAAESSAGEDPLAGEGWVDAGELSSSDGADDVSAAGDAPTADDARAADATRADDARADDARGNEVDTDTGDADGGSDDVTYTTSTAAGGRKSVSGNAESIREDSGAAGGDDGGTADGSAGANDGQAASNDAGGTDGEADDGRPSMTALENTKVMRLLQNREFPVDREEIRAVAVNAYDMSESQFDKVVDAAVDRGLIDEQNGQFVEAN